MKILVFVKICGGDINPFDASALECALRLGGETTAVCMGPAAYLDKISSLIRLGVSRAILLSDPAFAGSDTLATSYALSLAAKKIGYDLIICGRQSVDGDTAQVGPQLSARLKLPLIPYVMTADVTGGKIKCVTRDGEREEKLPALITLERSYNLRFPSLRSRPGKAEIWSAHDIGADKAKCGLAGSPTRVLQSFENKTGRRKCTFISAEELMPLVNSLRTSCRAEKQPELSADRLDKVCFWGEGVSAQAKNISLNALRLTGKTPEELALEIKKEDPDAVLWEASPPGRVTAPVTAALLNAGLCADCTRLDVEGKSLIMYRPAGAGTITAKIKCLTRPQMATVRCCSDAGDIIVSAGLGAAGCLDKIRAFAKKEGAGFGASRALVDSGRADYTEQIGLTGRTVAPKIYIAAGISGAVHHMCAVEGAGTVIAINSDKSARIFDYADYGIVADVEKLFG